MVKLQRNKVIKIGITSNPERRKTVHSRDGWKQMVVKYKTGSVRNANTIEKLFIEQRQELTNEWPGFSNMPSPGPYFVYLLRSSQPTILRLKSRYKLISPSPIKESHRTCISPLIFCMMPAMDPGFSSRMVTVCHLSAGSS